MTFVEVGLPHGISQRSTHVFCVGDGRHCDDGSATDVVMVGDDGDLLA